MKIGNYKVRLLIVIVVFMLFTGIFTTLAKYIIEEFHSYYLNANHFYFTSNRLTKANATYLINNWSGVGNFDISFDLLSEKNSLVYSDFDIPYTVTVTCPVDVTCTSDKPTGTIYQSSQTHSDSVVVSVSPQRAYGENEILTVHIVASSTSPYVETITADFQYKVGKSGVSYEIVDSANSVYLMFNVTNAITYCLVNTAFGDYAVGDPIDNAVFRTLSQTDRDKCVGKKIDISFNPNVIVLDTTDNILKTATYTNTTINGIDYISTLSYKIDPVSTLGIKFYKADVSQNYTYPIVNNSSIISVSIHD